ncbi:exported hypothetical protein [uncultured Paludibacter sp.]|nr:exported hypothetical protein [uncultured Paludibacter sp.]
MMMLQNLTIRKFMKKVYFIVLIFILSVHTGISQNTTAPFKKQLWKNAHLSWDVDNGDGYKWSNFAIGTGLARNFEFDKKSYWYLMGDLNWSKYTLYPDGQYAMGANKAYFRTFSFSIPAYVGYNVYQSSLRAFGVKVYTGPIFETIFSGKLDGYTYKEYNPIQFGWTVGTGVKLFYLFGFNLAYRYYPTPVLTNGNLVRNSINFTFGF